MYRRIFVAWKAQVSSKTNPKGLERTQKTAEDHRFQPISAQGNEIRSFHGQPERMVEVRRKQSQPGLHVCCMDRYHSPKVPIATYYTENKIILQ